VSGSVEPEFGRLAWCTRFRGDSTANVRREDGEVRVGDGSEALFGGEGLLAERQRLRVIAAQMGSQAGEHERDRGAGMVGRARERQDRVGVEDHGIVDLQAGQGELAQEPQGALDISGDERERHRREQVVVLAGEASAPLDLSRPVALRPRDAGKVGVVIAVTASESVGLFVLGKTFLAVLADGLQQPVAGIETGVVRDDEGPRHQIGEQLGTRVAIAQTATDRQVSSAADADTVWHYLATLAPADRAQTIIAFSPNASHALAAIVAGNIATAPH
jgi:hypothetical protein